MDEWNKLTTEYLFLSASSSCLYPYAVTLVAVCLILYNKSTGVIWILCHPDDVIFHDNEFHIAQHIIEPLKFSHLLRGPWGRHSALSFYFCLLLSSYNPNTSKLALKLKTLHLTGKKKKKKAKARMNYCTKTGLKLCNLCSQAVPVMAVYYWNRDFRLVPSECATH